MAVNEVTAYWDLFEKLIINDSKTKYEHTEIRKNYVNVSQQLNYNFI